MYPKNKRSALMALLAAGGLWAWQNRDKISAWVNDQQQRMQRPNSNNAYTDYTRRIDDTTPYTSTTDAAGPVRDL